jgi:hypothetical protein
VFVSAAPDVVAFADSRGRARVIVGGLLALAQIVAFAHVALVEHRTCAMHGETTHGAHGAVSPDFELASLPAARPVSDAVSGGHDHCVCMALGRERYVLSPLGSDGMLAIVSVALQGLQVARQPVLSIAVFSLAPKNSPPA